MAARILLAHRIWTNGFSPALSTSEIVVHDVLRIAGRAMRSAGNLLYVQRSELVFNLAKPLSLGGSAMRLDSRMTGEPVIDGLCLAHATAILPFVNVQIVGTGSIDRARKLQKLAAAIPPMQRVMTSPVAIPGAANTEIAPWRWR